MTPLEVGRRYLVRKRYSDDHFEITVDEISPTGLFFKSRATNWARIDDYSIDEELPALESAQKPHGFELKE